jgi:phosphoglycolate phosphatase-like HAD superfamily hydrolase
VPRPTVLLFDVDGTLITTGGAGRRAIERAFSALHGGDGALAFSLGGMTDRGIVRAGLRERGLPDGDEAIDALLERYLVLLDEEVRGAGSYRAHPGVRELLEALGERAAVGLGTGNIARGAEIKLARVDLWRRFAFGGFGSDHEERAEILRIGAARGAERLGLPLAACRVVAIGDTPRDVLAAHAAGARCVGVATGSYTTAQLRDAGADAVFATLADPRAAADILEG